MDDYATRRADLETLLDALPKKHPPIRLLLIDWATPHWLDSGAVDLFPEQGQGEPLRCDDWDEASFVRVLPLLWPKDRPALDADASKALFNACEGNPLALARLLGQPGPPQAQGRRAIFRDWAKRVRRRLLEKGLAEPDLPVLTLACWCGGYPFDLIDSTRADFPEDNRPANDLRAYASLRNPAGRNIPALHPETLAVEFVLEELRYKSPAYQQWLRRQGWAVQPEGSARSLRRLHRLALQAALDPEEQTLLAFLDTDPAQLPGLDNPQAPSAWQALREGLQKEAEERQQQAEELRGLIHGHGEEGEWDAMAAKFLELRGMVEAWPGHWELKIVLAYSLVNLTAFYGGSGQREPFAQALAELHGLAAAYPGTEAIQLELAKGLVNTAKYYGEQGDLSALATVLAELRGMAAAHLGDEAIQLELSNGLCHAT